MPVYFAFRESDKTVKIGFSKNVNQRLKSLKNEYKEQLKIINVLEASPRHEYQFHRYFKKYHITGEWFNFCEQMKNASISDLSTIMPKRQDPNKLPFDIMYEVKNHIINCRGEWVKLSVETGVSYETLAKTAQGGKTSMTTKHAQAILDHQAKKNRPSN